MSNKKLPQLTVADKFYIDNHPGLSSELISSQIGKTAGQIDRYRKKSKVVEVVKEEPKQEKVAKDESDKIFQPKPMIDNLFGRKRRSETTREGSITIMTPAAAEMSDAHKKANKKDIFTNSAVTKARND